jgi:hypothetical protein
MEENSPSAPVDPILVWRDSAGNEIKRGPYSQIGPEFAACKAVNAGAGTLTPADSTPPPPAASPAPVAQPAPVVVVAPPAPKARPAVPVRVVAPVASPSVSSGWGELTVDPDKARQINERVEKIRAAGFAIPPTFFAPGTRMVQEGVDKYRAIYAEWAKRPPAEEVLSAVSQRIREEKRQSFSVRLGDLRMASDGTIGRKGGPSRLIEWSAWDQIYAALRGDIFPDGSRLLRALDPEMRAAVFNSRIAAFNPDKVMKFGVRRHAEVGWSIFRVVGEKFPDHAAGDVACETAAKALKGLDFRGHVSYDPATTDVRFDAASMADPTALDPAVGDIFRAGIKGSTNDSGGGAFKIDPFIGRIVCINCTVADGYAPGVKKAHRGDMTEAMGEIRRLAKLAHSVLPVFAADWKVLRNTGFARFPWSKALRLDKDTKAELSDPNIHGYDVIRNLVDSGAITPEVGRDATVEALLSAYKKEPGDSLADIINAVTRSAHENIVDAAARDVMERRAGMLVPVLARVARGEDAQAR